MSRESDYGLSARQVEDFLVSCFDRASTDAAPIGGGAWSHCFAFRRGKEELVVRFGKHLEDFQRDQRAHGFAAPGLPIPEVLAIGGAFDRYYAVSTRVYGVPLESVRAVQWRVLAHSIVSALEALRLADISSTTGFGGWGADGNAPYRSWSGFLLSVGDDRMGSRSYGWRKKLETLAEGEAAFDWAFKLLKRVAIDAVPRNLVHCDFINRNVLVSGERITGVFDWGCSMYGDHLYDLALIEFWAPWFPQLDMRLLRSELDRRWRNTGASPENKDARLLACYLHIGISHIAYNASLGDGAALKAVADRMRALVKGVEIRYGLDWGATMDIGGSGGESRRVAAGA